jgi:hypothetical protein
MRSRLLLAMSLFAVVGLNAGCGKSTVSSPAISTNGTPSMDTPSLDRAQVAGVVAIEPEVVEDGQFESADITSLGTGAGATVTAASINPLRFWRVITSVERSFEFAFADSDSTGRPTTAIVTVHRSLAGHFNILTGTPRGDSTVLDSSVSVIRKPLADRWVRRILLKRVPAADSAGRAWRVVATSAARVTSRDATTQITSLRFQTAGVDTTITDPLRFFYLRRILKLEPGTSVTLTVTTLKNDDVVVMCRFGHRFRFHNNGDNTYTGVWQVPDLRMGNGPRPGPGRPPIFHFGVNALSHGTLFDDRAPYDSQAWVLPVVLAPDQVADALP